RDAVHPRGARRPRRVGRGRGHRLVLAGGRTVLPPAGGLRRPDRRRAAPRARSRCTATATPTRWLRAFVDAAVQAGHPDNDDYNAGDSRGASFARATIRGGRRATAWRSYVRPVAGSPLLRVVTDALVTRVVVDGDRAVGGEYVRDGERRTIRAEKEVVLSAGVFGTPQLLMPSGIGAADELRPHGIDVVRDLPGVGRNLRDHVASPLVWASRLDVPAPRMTGIEAQLIADSGDAGDDPARPAGGLRLLRLLHAHRRPAGAGVHRARDPAAPGEPRSGAAALRRPPETPLIDPAIPSDPRDLDALVDHL